MDFEHIQQQAWAWLSQRPSNLYFVFDAARNRSWFRALNRTGSSQPVSLYSGTAAITLADFAPYLLDLKAATDAQQRIVQQTWGQSFGIFVQSRANLPATRLDLKKSLIGTMGERSTYFRFYDPRAWARFIATADGGQMAQFFRDSIVGVSSETGDGHIITTVEKTRSMLGILSDFKIEHRKLDQP